MSWPERAVGWDEALIERARTLFAETAERFGLKYEWDETAPVEVACRYPAQDGLDFDLWLSMAGDEFVCSGDRWYATIFPADDELKWKLIARLVEELITGEARIALGWKRPFWTEAQLQINGRWKSVSTGVGCAVPPIIRPTILRNRHPQQVGLFRPALGSAMALMLIFGAIYWLLK